VFIPFDHRIRLWVGVTLVIALLLVGLVMNFGLVHLP
jgi:hypothetical protein